MNKTIRLLQQRRAALKKSANDILENAKGRDLTAQEQSSFDAFIEQIEALDVQINRATEQAFAEAGIDSATGKALPSARGTIIQGGEPGIARDPNHGFSSFGEFACSVRQYAGAGEIRDERLRIGAATPTTFGNELTGPDGGFLVPPAFSRDIFQHAFSEDSLLPLTDQYELPQGNSMGFPKDEGTAWGTDGIRAYWQAEATAGTQTKPKLSTTMLRLYKLMSLIPLSDELVDDNNISLLDQYLPQKVGLSVRWKANEAILWGSGAGQPLGAFNSNAVVTVQKETSQAASTLLVQNLAKMIARLPEGSFKRCIWLINNEVLPGLISLNNAGTSSGASGNFPIWIPAASGVQNANPYGTLFGRPVLITQHAKAYSSQGDVMLFDPFYVRSITKGGIRAEISMHLYFDADALAFRSVFRMDSKPKIVNPIAPANGSSNLSPFVQLGAR